MTEPALVQTSWVEISSLQIQDAPPTAIAAFAIDSPREGDRVLGAGLEINGWAIGRTVPVQSVRTTTNCRRNAHSALDVRRPDVAADYPAFAHASASGFTAWAPIDPAEGKWRVSVEAVLANGDVTTLAWIAGNAGIETRATRDGARQVTAPDFVIIGAQRGGTTSLHAYLSAHPKVRTPATKELHFVTDRYERGHDWYRGQFPRDLPPGTLTGEATPYALFHPLAAGRLRQVAPEAKLIALLRNPVDRAYSHYLFERARGDEPLEFAAALDAEPRRLAGEEAALARCSTYVSKPHKHASYVARGNYAPQLERWFAHFPREQMLVLRSEDFYGQTPATFARVTAFLKMKPEIDMSFAAHNSAAGPPMEASIRRRLTRRFAPLNVRLAELLGWDPDWR